MGFNAQATSHADNQRPAASEDMMRIPPRSDIDRMRTVETRMQVGPNF